jgi:DNA-binding SARP family transcriptional activator/tetratricopeptide (TPR) repeat protein
MKYRLLGPVQFGDGTEIGSPQERRLLALLCLHRNHVVSIDRMEEVIWGAVSPQSARLSVQSKISRLRRIVGTASIGHTAAGYTLFTGPTDCDVEVFERMADKAMHWPTPASELCSMMEPVLVEGGSGADRLSLIDEALGLWNGRAFGDLADEPFAAAEAIRLDRRRMTLLEERAWIFVERGDADAVLAVTDELIAHDPYRERVWEARILAFAEAGRIVEGLRALQMYRDRLVNDLGLDPSERLLRLERELLDGTIPRWSNRGVVVQAGQVLVAPSSSDAAEGLNGNDHRSRGEVRMRPIAGFSDPACEVSAPTWWGSVVTAPSFVGREREVAELRSVFRSAQSGASVVLLTGEGGVGKSRLCRESVREARLLGWTPITLSCSAVVMPLFAPLRRLGLRLGIENVVAPNHDATPASLRAGMVADWTERICQQLPDRSLVLVEDLHWCDAGTLEVLSAVLSFLSEPGDERTTVFLLTSRPVLIGPQDSHELAALKSRLLREAPVLSLLLEGLVEPEVFELVSSATHRRCDPALTDTLCRASNGNPLLALTALQSLRASGQLRIRDGWMCGDDHINNSVPSDLASSLENVLTTLPASGRELLNVLALSQTGVSQSVLIGLTSELFARPLEELRGLIRTLEHLGLVVIGESGVRFRHDLYRHVLINAMDQAEATDLHWRLASLLIAQAMSNGDELDSLSVDECLDLANHLDALPPVLSPDQCREGLVGNDLRLRVFVTAARICVSFTDWPNAGRYFRCALRCAESLSLSDMDQLELSLEAGSALFHAHDPEAAAPLLCNAIATARSVGDAKSWGAALLDFRRLSLTLNGKSPTLDLSDVEEFVHRFGHQEPELAARLLGLTAEHAFSVGNLDAAEAYQERAMVFAQLGLTPLLSAELCFASGLNLLGRFKLENALDQFERSRTLAVAAGSGWVASWGAGRSLFVQILLGRNKEAESQLREVDWLQRQAHQWSELSFTATMAATLAALAGDYDALHDHLREAKRLVHRTGYAHTIPYLFPLEAWLGCHRQRYDEALAGLAQWTLEGTKVPPVFPALLHARNGDRHQASQLLAEVGWRPLVPTRVHIGNLAAVAAQIELASLLDDVALFAASVASAEFVADCGIEQIPGWPSSVGALFASLTPLAAV